MMGVLLMGVGLELTRASCRLEEKVALVREGLGLSKVCFCKLLKEVVLLG